MCPSTRAAALSTLACKSSAAAISSGIVVTLPLRRSPRHLTFFLASAKCAIARVRHEICSFHTGHRWSGPMYHRHSHLVPCLALLCDSRHFTVRNASPNLSHLRVSHVSGTTIPGGGARLACSAISSLVNPRRKRFQAH